VSEAPADTAGAGAEPSASPAPTAAPTLPPAAHRPQTIHVLEDPIGFTTVPVPGCTSRLGCKGEKFTGRAVMLDAVTRKAVGMFQVACVLVDPSTGLRHCPANTITLTGRGSIVFDETFYLGGTWYPKPWPITSGTGEFLGAIGSVASPKDSTWLYGDFVITITG
jgi:hypothetical protein